MIFAAGLGTRLKPLTDYTSKALVEVGGKALLEIAILKLLHFGFNEIVVNVHHFAQAVVTFLRQKDFGNVKIYVSDESEMLLDTGGGLKKAAPLLAGKNPVLIYNVDVISDIDLDKVISDHCSDRRLATLVVRERKSSRNLYFDREMNLTGWKNELTGEEKISRKDVFVNSRPFAFSGIHVINPQMLDLLGEGIRFSIIDTYIHLAGVYRIAGYQDTSSVWLDVGKPEQLAEAEQLTALQKRIPGL